MQEAACYLPYASRGLLPDLPDTVRQTIPEWMLAGKKYWNGDEVGCAAQKWTDGKKSG